MIDECEPMQIDSEEAVKHKEKMMNGSNNTKYLTAEDYVSYSCLFFNQYRYFN